MNGFRLTLAAAFAAGALAGCADEGDIDLGEAVELTDGTIEVLDNEFSPDLAEVPVDTVVVWDFDQADNDHDVVFIDGPSSDTMSQGTWSREFNEPGTYRYVCTWHSGMEGTVIVVDDA